MMLLAFFAIQAVERFASVPLAPPPRPPFTQAVEIAFRVKGARVNAAYKVCGDARTNANGRWVDAMGTPQHSAAWETATSAAKSALLSCQEQRHALRDQAVFIENVIINGSGYDSNLASKLVDDATSALTATEQFYARETPRYRHLLTIGWGSPHCMEHADGYAPPSSICAAGENPFQP